MLKCKNLKKKINSQINYNFESQLTVLKNKFQYREIKANPSDREYPASNFEQNEQRGLTERRSESSIEGSIKERGTDYRRTPEPMHDRREYRHLGNQRNYGNQNYGYCKICSELNFNYCEPPCRNSLGTNERVPKGMVVILPNSDYNYDYKLEVIFEQGEERLRYYEILRNRNMRKPSPNDYIKIYPSEILNLGYTLLNKGKDLSYQNFILSFEPHDRIYVGPKIVKDIKCCKDFRKRMAYNKLAL